jgi:hypothetical protein
VADFWHVTQYAWSAAEDLFAEDGAGLRPWVDSWCHRLKHESGAATASIADLEARGEAPGRKRLPAKLEAALTYLRNQVRGGRVSCAELVAQHMQRLDLQRHETCPRWNYTISPRNRVLRN